MISARFEKVLACWVALVIFLIAAGCQKTKKEEHEIVLNGAGATFPYPIYSKWFSEYNKLHPNIKINYQSIGSGGGIRQLLSGTVDFGASDTPMSDEQLKQSGVKILHIPTVLGGVVPIYNIPGVKDELRFSPEVLAGIFLGKIIFWDDAKIKKLNPDSALPHKAILAVHRSDGSGTTFIFTDYLSKVSGEWEKKVGRGPSLNWPVGIGGKGNEGVAGTVLQTPGSIGYVELIYAVENKINYGSVQNKTGNFVKADFETVSSAAASISMPADFRVSIADAAGENAYPIASFTWLLIPIPAPDPEKGKVIADFLSWMVAHGESLAPYMSYAPLPDAVAEKVKEEIKEIH